MQMRVRYFDTIKFFAILWVYLVHFISYYCSSLFSYWRTAPTSWVLFGVTGKLAVAMFSVILGYFAYLSGTKGGSLSNFTIKRYISFFITGLFINTLYAICGALGWKSATYDLTTVLVTSLKIGYDIFPTFWCMFDFLLSSVLSFINGKYRLSPSAVFLQIVIFLLVGKIWIAICLMGNLLYGLQHNETCAALMRKKPVQLLLFIIVFFAVKRPESNVTYVIDGICSMLVLLIISGNETFQKVLSCKPLSYLGKNSLGIYILHPLTYTLLGAPLFELLSPVRYSVVFIVVFITCLAVMLPLSIGAVFLIDRLSGLLSTLLITAKDQLLNKCAPLIRQVQPHT